MRKYGREDINIRMPGESPDDPPVVFIDGKPKHILEKNEQRSFQFDDSKKLVLQTGDPHQPIDVAEITRSGRDYFIGRNRKNFQILDNTQLLFGRHNKPFDLKLDNRVSGNHLLIKRQGENLIITDTSTNGTIISMEKNPTSIEALPDKYVVLDGAGSQNLAEKKEVFNGLHYEVAAATNQGINYKEWNEDRVVFNPAQLKLAVIDGMGGVEGGQEAAERLAQQISQTDNLKLALENAHQVIDRGDVCVSAAEIIENDGQKYLEHYWAGDVKCLVMRDQKIIYESRDDALVQIGDPHYAKLRNRVTNCIGPDCPGEIHHQTIPIQSGDVIFIGSDGVTDNLSPREINQYIDHNDMKKSISILSQITQQRMSGSPDLHEYDLPMKKDNQSVIMVKVK